MAELIAGIDLGTSNSVITVVVDGSPVVIPDHHGNRIHPSVVYFDTNGQTIIGNDAVPYLAIQPDRTIFSSKRLMGRTMDSPELRMLHGAFPFQLRGSNNKPDAPVRIVIDQTYHPPEGIGARVLNYMKNLADDYIGEPINKAVITVPANFDEGQRQATMQAGKLAGFEVLQLVNEPTAAALAYGHEQNKRERVAIYDFGGGTFDITILELRGNVYEVLGTAGRSYLGGDDFDLQVVDEIIFDFERVNNVQFNYREHPIRYPLKSVAKEIKHKLSVQDPVTQHINLQIPGTFNTFALDFTMTRSRFNEITRDLVERSLKTCEEALRLANLQSAQIEHLVMVGGSTRVPIVQQRAEQYFNRKSASKVNPDEVVSIGAAIFADSLVTRPPSIPPMRGTQHGAPAPFSGPGGPPGIPGMPNAPGSSGLPPLRGGGTSGPPPLFGNSSGFGNASGAPGLSSSGAFGQSGFGRHGASAPYASAIGANSGLDTGSYNRAPSAPLLIDVTPHALGIETIGGIMDVLIEQNAALPLSRQRTFVASRDNQTEVVIPIYAGSSRQTSENRMLGVIELKNIVPGMREDVQIEVLFEINTSGILSVSATDLRTGAAQSANLSISGVSTNDYQSASTLASR